MSKRFWIGMLRKAIAMLLGANWAEIKDVVQTLMESEASGEEKRRIALIQLRIIGVEVATWLLSAAIEVAYGLLKETESSIKKVGPESEMQDNKDTPKVQMPADRSVGYSLFYN